MDAIKIVINIIEVILIGYFGFASLYIFLFALAGVFSLINTRWMGGHPVTLGACSSIVEYIESPHPRGIG